MKAFKTTGAAIVATAALAGLMSQSGGTFSLWSTRIPFGAVTYTPASASFSVAQGSEAAVTATGLGHHIVSPAAADFLNDMKAYGKAATVVKVTGSATGDVGVSYSVPSISGTGVFADADATLKLFSVSDAASCTTSITGTPLYSGEPSAANVASTELLAKPAGGATGTRTAEQLICMVAEAPPSAGANSHTATVTGTTEDGPVSATDTWAVNGAGVTTGAEGTLSLNVDWAISR